MKGILLKWKLEKFSNLGGILAKSVGFTFVGKIFVHPVAEVNHFPSLSRMSAKIKQVSCRNNKPLQKA